MTTRLSSAAKAQIRRFSDDSPISDPHNESVDSNPNDSESPSHSTDSENSPLPTLSAVVDDMAIRLSVESEIQYLLSQPQVNLEALRRLSRSPGGFQTKELRRRVWPKLCGINRYALDDFADVLALAKTAEESSEEEDCEEEESENENHKEIEEDTTVESSVSKKTIELNQTSTVPSTGVRQSFMKKFRRVTSRKANSIVASGGNISQSTVLESTPQTKSEPTQVKQEVARDMITDDVRWNKTSAKSKIVHRDDSQVRCDVDRSLWSLECDEPYREKRRQVLLDIIMAILCRNPSLHYFQGYHDVVSKLMLVMEEDHMAFALSEYVAINFLADYMSEDFEIVSHFMRVLFVFLKLADPELYEYLRSAKLEPFFATSWLITWFSHDISNLDAVARIFDVLLSSPPIFCYYLATAYVIHLRDDILRADCDFAALHNVLVRAPMKYGFPTEKLVAAADKLYELIPISRLLLGCDNYLLSTINSKKVSLFFKPVEEKSFAPSDSVLLRKLSTSTTHRFPVIRYYLGSWWYHLSYKFAALVSHRASVRVTPSSNADVCDDELVNIHRRSQLFGETIPRNEDGVLDKPSGENEDEIITSASWRRPKDVDTNYLWDENPTPAFYEARPAPVRRLHVPFSWKPRHFMYFSMIQLRLLLLPLTLPIQRMIGNKHDDTMTTGGGFRSIKRSRKDGNNGDSSFFGSPLFWSIFVAIGSAVTYACIAHSRNSSSVVPTETN